MKFSLLMALYNNVAYIKRAINSVKAQTYKDWELIIVDDGSVDGSTELANALSKKDKRIKLFKNEKNIGYNATMIELASHATGDIWAHFDSDDMLERWALEEMKLAFEKNPDVALIYSDFAQIGKDDSIECYNQSHNFDKDKLWQHGWRHFGAYRASAYRQVQGYNPHLIGTNGCSDGDLFMQIAERFPVMRLPKVLYFYRNHGNNISTKNAKCESCDLRFKCNYARVWTKAANYDLQTFKKID